MLEELARGQRVIGVKQSHKAIRNGDAQKVFFAADADPELLSPLKELCEKNGVPNVCAGTMSELGQACGIGVGAAVAVLLKRAEE
ncbi:MAG: ribosomal L7Ae/L30e/S12e/Gadd45 family protein [Oscillospiraceae bacterium]|nr:ribosomal L7Ae/L30e/S12e/Gadd45 family protein [Oscillospiraceae bacterium]